MKTFLIITAMIMAAGTANANTAAKKAAETALKAARGKGPVTVVPRAGVSNADAETAVMQNALPGVRGNIQVPLKGVHNQPKAARDALAVAIQDELRAIQANGGDIDAEEITDAAERGLLDADKAESCLQSMIEEPVAAEKLSNIIEKMEDAAEGIEARSGNSELGTMTNAERLEIKRARRAGVSAETGTTGAALNEIDGKITEACALPVI